MYLYIPSEVFNGAQGSLYIMLIHDLSSLASSKIVEDALDPETSHMLPVDNRVQEREPSNPDISSFPYRIKISIMELYYLMGHCFLQQDGSFELDLITKSLKQTLINIDLGSLE